MNGSRCMFSAFANGVKGMAIPITIIVDVKATTGAAAQL